MATVTIHWSLSPGLEIIGQMDSDCAGTLPFPRRRRSDLTKPNEQERITAGWIISGVENQLCSVPQRYKSHLDHGCGKGIGPRLPVTLAIEPTRGTSPPAMRLRDFLTPA